MTDRERLLDLAERLEAAEAGSRELDIEIARALGGAIIDGKWETASSWGDVPQTTTSVDAAFALTFQILGERWQIRLNQYTPQYQREIHPKKWEALLELETQYGLEDEVYGRHSDLPLALCAALLRARADGGDDA